MIISFNCLASENLKPIIIIRFNDENINYHKHLSKVVEKAISLKHDVKFKVLSLIKNDELDEYDLTKTNCFDPCESSCCKYFKSRYRTK